MNKKQVAAALGVTVKAIDKWVLNRRIPFLRLSRKCVRFRPSEIEIFIEDHKQDAAPNKNPEPFHIRESCPV